MAEVRKTTQEQRALAKRSHEETIAAIKDVRTNVALLTKRADELLSSSTSFVVSANGNLTMLSTESAFAIRELVEEAKPSLRALGESAENLNKLTGDPNLPKLLDESAKTMENVNATTATLKVTTKRVDDAVAKALKPARLTWSVIQKVFDLVLGSLTAAK